ncbi:Mu transposase C-terminal domain-containing protein [Aquitalea sp. LB_tupeE]|uniref:Mu transposase C-terminal domain-containing protein n=1 Tax=Aquitalea sp. LB_tupeE TaxID=2748078 RepID=UPI003519DE97
MQLTGIPTSKVGIRDRAERECWPVHNVTGIGGTRKQYMPPASIMAQIRTKAAAQLAATVQAPSLPSAPQQLPLLETEAQALTADARRGVLNALELLMQRSGYARKKAATVLVDMARVGAANPQLVAMLKMARDGRGRKSLDGLPSPRSVLRFVEYQQAGSLVPKKREADMSVPAWAPCFLSHYQRPEKPTVEHAYHAFLQEWGAQQPLAKLPSISQVRRFLRKVGQVSRHVGRMGERELKSLRPFIRRDFDSLLPGDVYSADGHAFDAEIQHPLHGRPFRPEITTMVDIATRKAVGWSVSLAESALAVLDALRDACLKNGVPAVLYVDNGSGYKNQMMLDSATGFMSRLGIEMVNSLPYNSQARGVIERLHHTIWVKAAKTLPGYIGKDMDRQARLANFKLSRQAIRQAGQSGSTATMPLLAWADFVQFCEQQVADYNNRPHRSLPRISDPDTGRKRHMTPNEKWALHVAQGFEAHLVSDDEARPLFRPQLLRTVRRCEIELLGNRYFATALEEFHSEQLRIGYDIHDPARVWVYDADGRFICTAELDANKRDYVPQSAIQRAKTKRAQGRERLLQNKLDEVRQELHGRPALEQMETVSIPGVMVLDRSQLAARAQALHQEPAKPRAATTDSSWQVPTTPEARWQAWQALMAIDESDMADEKAKKWRHTYQATAEFRTYQRKTA